MKNSPSQAKMELVDQLEQQITALQNRLANLKSEEAQVVRRRTLALDDVKRETEQLLASRNQELQKVKSEFKESIAVLEKYIIGRTLTFEQLKTAQFAVETSLKEGRQEADNLNADLKVLQASINHKFLEEKQLLERKNALVIEVEALEKQKNALPDQITTLIIEKSGLEETIDLLQTKKNLLIQEIAKMQNDAVMELDVLENKRAVLSQQIEQINTNEERTRSDLATRLRAINEREINLRIRERKVADGEETIKRNAMLLDL